MIYCYVFSFSFADLTLTNEQLQNYALFDIEMILRSNGRSLSDFPPMSVPDLSNLNPFQNRLIVDELNYNKEALKLEARDLIDSMTSEQKGVYNTLIDSVKSGNSGVFFLYGYGGTGKTYIWQALTSSLRFEGRIVLT